MFDSLKKFDNGVLTVSGCLPVFCGSLRGPCYMYSLCQCWDFNFTEPEDFVSMHIAVV